MLLLFLEILFLKFFDVPFSLFLDISAIRLYFSIFLIFHKIKLTVLYLKTSPKRPLKPLEMEVILSRFLS